MPDKTYLQDHEDTYQQQQHPSLQLLLNCLLEWESLLSRCVVTGGCRPKGGGGHPHWACPSHSDTMEAMLISLLRVSDENDLCTSSYSMHNMMIGSVV